MSSIPKVKSLNDLKSLVNNYRGVLSEGNVKIINQIIREMEKGGGISQSNRSQLMKLMQRLADRNGVSIPKKK